MSELIRPQGHSNTVVTNYLSSFEQTQHGAATTTNVKTTQFPYIYQQLPYTTPSPHASRSMPYIPSIHTSSGAVHTASSNPSLTQFQNANLRSSQTSVPRTLSQLQSSTMIPNPLQHSVIRTYSQLQGSSNLNSLQSSAANLSQIQVPTSTHVNPLVYMPSDHTSQSVSSNVVASYRLLANTQYPSSSAVQQQQQHSATPSSMYNSNQTTSMKTEATTVLNTKNETTSNTTSSTTGPAVLTPRHKVHLRKAAGIFWSDPSLDDWPDNDYRIFCGDLGNEVTDELLSNAFRYLKSFQRARVIRDKRTGKGKGFGFVSFGNPEDMLRGIKEMDRKYVGNRPIRVMKSNWKDREVESEKNKRALEIAIPLNCKELKKFKRMKPVTGGKKGFSAPSSTAPPTVTTYRGRGAYRGHRPTPYPGRG